MAHTYNMTDSQFKSFMSRVERAAREEAGRLFYESANVVRTQARTTAAAVARDEAKQFFANPPDWAKPTVKAQTNGKHHAANGHQPTPIEGWKVVVEDGTEFIYFRGQWRRRSELEAYASAAKYL